MFILDTNVLSTVIAAQPAPPVAAWMLAQPTTLIFTASVCQAEILAGIAVMLHGRRRESLERRRAPRLKMISPAVFCLSITRLPSPMAISLPPATASAGRVAPRI